MTEVTKDRKSPVPSSRGKRPRTIDPARYEAARARAALLCVDGISVSFDGFQALENLTLVVHEGELRCVIGPNGAGKTTLQDVITGKTRPDSGSVFLVGDTRELTHLSECEISRIGIGRKFQKPTVFNGHSVFENLELALARRKGIWSSLFGRLEKHDTERIDEILEIIGLAAHRDGEAYSLSHGQKQWLEIGMLLAQNPRILLIDEPVAGMTEAEVERTAELLKRLAGQHTLVVVEHDMKFVRSIANKVTVLHEGKVLAEGTMDAISKDPKVVEVYLGTT